MTEPMSTAELNAIDQRVNAATEGTYSAETHYKDSYIRVTSGTATLFHAMDYPLVEDGYEQSFRDAEFFAHARADILLLLAEIRRLQAMEKRVRGPLF